MDDKVNNGWYEAGQREREAYKAVLKKETEYEKAFKKNRLEIIEKDKQILEQEGVILKRKDIINVYVNDVVGLVE